MARTTRENLKKYRKLYYKKPKRKRIGHLQYAISAFLIWQLIIFQLVFTFNLSHAAAVGTEAEPATAVSEETPKESAEADKKDDGKNSRTGRAERSERDGALPNADETKKPETDAVEEKLQAEKAGENDSLGAAEKEKAIFDDPPAEEDSGDIWKTCGPSDLFGKVEDKKERDKCKENDSCGKIESCLNAIVEIENDTGIDNEIEASATTGGNEIEIEQPFPARDSAEDMIQDVAVDVASDIVQPETAANNDEIQDQGDRGRETDRNREDNRSAAADIENSSENALAEITTGDAVAVTDVANVVNTNIVGENGVETVENIYGDYEGDINLLDTFDSLLENAKNTNDGNQSVFGAMEISIENEAGVENDITTAADTGQNEIDNESEAGDSSITTGDAIAAANVVNIVNTNIIGNNFLFAVINVFGNWIGDLIVPGEDLLTVPASAQADNFIVNVENETNIENSVETSAETGQNKVETDGGAAKVETGEAYANNIVVNQIGSTIVANNWFFLAVNNMGNWMGSVLNWNKQANAYDTVFSFDFDEDEDLEEKGLAGWLTKISIRNEADIENSIETSANTGGNEIESEGGAASIKTGNAYAFSRVYNLINNNFIGSNWMFAVVNVFGTWQGNVNFIHPENTDVPDVPGDGGGTVPPRPGEETPAPETLAGQTTPEKKLNPSLALSRSVSERKINAGEIAKHTIVLENTGDATISDIVISDKVANKNGGAGNYVWKVEKLEPGKKAVVKYKLLINAGAPTGDYKNKASALGYDENGGEVRSNEAETKIAVGAAASGEAAAGQELYYYTYYTYYYYRKPAVPVESSFETISGAEASAGKPEGEVLGQSLAFWNRDVEPENFNPGWILLPAFLLLLMRRRDEKSASE